MKTILELSYTEILEVLRKEFKEELEYIGDGEQYVWPIVSPSGEFKAIQFTVDQTPK